MSVPTTIPLGPRTTVGPPSGSVIVSDEAGKPNTLPPKRMPSTEELGMVELGTVEPGAVEVEAELPGSKVKVKPSVVNVDSAVTAGSGIVSDPITIPDGPRTKVCPSGSVKVSDVLGRVNVVAPMTIPSGADVCDIDDTGTVPALAGSYVKVTPSVVMATGVVPGGNGIVSVPITIPLGPSITDCPSGSVIVVELDGIGKVEPPITISGGVEVRTGPIEVLVELGSEFVETGFDDGDCDMIVEETCEEIPDSSEVLVELFGEFVETGFDEGDCDTIVEETCEEIPDSSGMLVELVGELVDNEFEDGDWDMMVEEICEGFPDPSEVLTELGGELVEDWVNDDCDMIMEEDGKELPD